MKYILITCITVLQIGGLYAQAEEKYKISDEQMKEYRKLAGELAENMDTTLNLTDAEREKVYRMKLESLTEQHKFTAQQDELRQKIRDLAGEQKEIERKKNDEIKKAVVSKEKQEAFGEALRNEQKHLRQYEMQRRTQRRIERRKAMKAKRQEQQQEEED